MQGFRPLVLLGLFLAFISVSCGSLALAATPSFTITATSVTMSSNTSSGTGSTTFTLTSVDGYAGSVRVGCDAPTPPAGVKVPYCGDIGNGAAVVPVQPPITLTANEVVSGTVSFINSPAPCSNPCPVSLPRRGGHGLAPGVALAGVLLFGFGLRRRAARWLTLMLFALGILAGLAAISACGANNTVVTPGTYAYTLTATDINTNVSVTTPVNVTVP
jgi:hypothetical protein